jgi:PAS domain-containing protein
MKDEDKTREQLIGELAGLRKRIAQLEASETGHREMIESSLESREKYYNFFRYSRAALYITNRDGRFIEASQFFLNLFGYTREELENLKTEETYVNHSDRHRFQPEFANCIQQIPFSEGMSGAAHIVIEA